MRRRLVSFLVLLSAVLATRPAGAYEPLSFPLGDHYRIGRFLPVRVLVGPVQFRVTAAGGVPVTLDRRRDEVQAVVPMLAVKSLGQITTAVADRGRSPVKHTLRPLEPDERLIGTNVDAEEVDAVARELFPGRRIVREGLSSTDPLPGSALAWQTLDAVVLDQAAAARVSEPQLETLRASGTGVAVRADARPRGDWPWQRRGAWWVLPPDESAAASVVQPDRYLPPGDAIGAPVRFRRVLFGSLVCFALAVLAASLWRSRHAWVVVVLLSVAAAASVAVWNVNQPTSVALVTEDQVGPWRDRYTQYVARADAEIRHPISDAEAAAWPVLFSHRHAPDLTLDCRADGMPDAFVAKLKRGQSLVFLDRSLMPGVMPTPATATSPAAPPR